VVEELAKQDFQTERKRVEIPGNSFKSVGKYKVTVKLYENTTAEITLTVQAQVVKTETKAPSLRKDRRRRGVEAAPSPDQAEGTETGAVSGEAPPPAADAGNDGADQTVLQAQAAVPEA
jgi:large subunit ribosomal protein L9